MDAFKFLQRTAIDVVAFMQTTIIERFINAIFMAISPPLLVEIKEKDAVKAKRADDGEKSVKRE